MTGSSAGGRG